MGATADVPRNCGCHFPVQMSAQHVEISHESGTRFARARRAAKEAQGTASGYLTLPYPMSSRQSRHGEQAVHKRCWSAHLQQQVACVRICVETASAQHHVPQRVQQRRHGLPRALPRNRIATRQHRGERHAWKQTVLRFLVDY